MKAAIRPSAAVKGNLLTNIDATRPVAKVVRLSDENEGIVFWKFAAAASVMVALLSS